MDKIIHKLDMSSRYKIAKAYAEDKHSATLLNFTTLANTISEKLINNFHNIKPSFNKNNFDDLTKILDEIGLKENQMFPNSERWKGLVVLNYKSSGSYSHGIPFSIFEKNKFEIKIDDLKACRYIQNKNMSEKKIRYDLLLKRNDIEELNTLLNDYKNLSNQILKSFDDCYDLIKKIRSAELLMKHWSNAYKYLPDDIKIDKPCALSLSDKFDLL